MTQTIDAFNRLADVALSEMSAVRPSDDPVGAAVAAAALLAQSAAREVSDRDRVIRIARREGASLRMLAEATGLSRQTTTPPHCEACERQARTRKLSPLYRGAVRLYLVQHGQAKTDDEDPERPLTARGVDDVTRVAGHAVGKLGVRAARVVHSGKTRARQTAEVWGELLDAGVEQSDALAPNDDPAIWVERLDAEADDLVLVGHLPHLARLAGLLLTGDPDHQVVRFRPGGLVTLEPAGTGWVVSLVLPPEGA